MKKEEKRKANCNIRRSKIERDWKSVAKKMIKERKSHTGTKREINDEIKKTETKHISYGFTLDRTLLLLFLAVLGTLGNS